jgi:hypothetical protein
MQRQMQNPLERLQWLFFPHFEGAALDRDAVGDSLLVFAIWARYLYVVPSPFCPSGNTEYFYIFF